MNIPQILTYNPWSLAFIVLVVALDILGAITGIHLMLYVSIALAWLSMVVHAYHQLKKKRIGTEFFLVFATLVAVWGNQERAIAIVLLIMLIANYLEEFIEQRTEQELGTLISLIPTDVTIEDNGIERVIPIADLTPGMRVIISTGARIPADGTIIAGTATINQAALTGESTPVRKSLHEPVFAGTFVESGSVIINVTSIAEQTVFGKMMRLLEQAEKNKAYITLITERLVFFIAPALLLLIVAIWLITGNSRLVITLLIFGSPLELSLVAPLTLLAASVAAFKQGILIKSGRALELFASVDTIMFDKTGTLTLGSPTVVSVESFSSDYTKQDILRLVAIAEKRSDHVLAKAVVTQAREQQIDIPAPDEYESLAGHGVTIVYQGKRYFCGNRHYIQAPEHGNSVIPGNVLAGEEQTLSTFYLAHEGLAIGRISIKDRVRPDALITIQALRNAGISTMLLVSGDKEALTRQIGAELGIGTTYGEMFPDKKLALLSELQQSGHRVAMVGDGINDVAALKQAHVGIALGAMGMEPAIEAADIVLITNNLDKIYFVRKLSQQAVTVIKQNVLIGFLLIHLLGLLLTLMGLVTPIQAAIAHAISDIIILLNATRLIRFRVSLPKP